MMLLAIDPGPVQSAFCLMDEHYRANEKGKVPNDALMEYIWMNAKKIDHIAIEMIASYGMAVGAETFETCTIIGRIEQTADIKGIPNSRVYRIEEKTTICHDSRAKDTNIRHALIDRFAREDKKRGVGTKKDPDWFYGFAGDMWAAFAVGVVYLDKQRAEGGEI